jgi:hypothetical protein
MVASPKSSHGRLSHPIRTTDGVMQLKNSGTNFEISEKLLVLLFFNNFQVVAISRGRNRVGIGITAGTL